jgi:hypothetical protein
MGAVKQEMEKLERFEQEELDKLEQLEYLTEEYNTLKEKINILKNILHEIVLLLDGY